jgi:cytochrome P450 family 110
VLLFIVALTMPLPPGDHRPALLQTLQLIANPTGYLDRCAAQFGDTFTLRILGINSPPVVFIRHPDDVQMVFGSLADAFEYGKVTQVFQPLVGNESLIMQQGKRHQSQRQMLMPAFQREKLQTQADRIQQCAIAQVRTWQVGSTIDLRLEMSSVSLQVILAVVFGMTTGDRTLELRDRLAVLLEKITGTLYSVQFFLPPLQANLGPWSPWGGFLAQMRAIDALIEAEIAERRQQEFRDRSDILSMLMGAVDADGAALSNQELRDQLITLLLLGHETTASSLAWAFYWLHRSPNAATELMAELSQNQDSAFELSDRPWLTAVCKEALRVYPIALISQPRRVKTPITLAGYALSAGTIVIPCVYTAHRRVETYGADAAEFRPDRFMQRKFSASEYFPFGGGSRNCIGMGLSLLEMKIVLGTTLQRVKLELVGESRVYPVRRGITFVPPTAARFRVLENAWRDANQA